MQVDLAALDDHTPLRRACHGECGGTGVGVLREVCNAYYLTGQVGLAHLRKIQIKNIELFLKICYNIYRK